MASDFEKRLHVVLPFSSRQGVWRRIAVLESEMTQVVRLMNDCAGAFRQVLAEPRELYLNVQQVRSLTVYIRWRRRGVRGQQAYCLLNSPAGQAVLLRQAPELQQCYRQFDHWALALNLAHSLRLNEIRRLKKYLKDLG
ncbi:hypothetical protein GO003_021240 [Methylicorpusculum oleiharenae]|uniref:hypothetical protein n=1 Tax=Methylicorpusculum oleiharenae TaxID=1338687 RepID=UPI0013575BF1|nr:hypothetical protein [Methylicorpusculum oleiharenae]MCD2452910.1 hypothetical protein [Methylicorpusculum oleiharenae]